MKVRLRRNFNKFQYSDVMYRRKYQHENIIWQMVQRKIFLNIISMKVKKGKWYENVVIVVEDVV